MMPFTLSSLLGAGPRCAADMFQKDCCALIVVSGSGMCKVGFTGDYAPRFMFPSGGAWPKMLDIMAGMDQPSSHSCSFRTQDWVLHAR